MISGGRPQNGQKRFFRTSGRGVLHECVKEYPGPGPAGGTAQLS